MFWLTLANAFAVDHDNLYRYTSRVYVRNKDSLSSPPSKPLLLNISSYTILNNAYVAGSLALPRVIPHQLSATFRSFESVPVIDMVEY